ncbi:MAG: TonB-dependent receptor domain-containing protein [Pseudomonadota bacterium]
MLGGVALACAAGRAEAADARLRLDIPSRPYADALIDLGLQANVSILGTSSCGAGGRVAISGRYTLRQALDRLLANAPCDYVLVDSRTVRIVPTQPRGEPSQAAAPPRDPVFVSEIVVTATKRPAALSRLPAGVSAISRDQIAATRAVDVGQTTGQLAGVLTTNLGPGRDKLLIRGLSDGAFTGRTRSTVGTYLDDAPVNYNAPDPDLRLADIERIEVVRGPQGALYGSGAMAGVFRIVTAKPDLHRATAGVLAGAAATDGGDESHEIEGFLNLPLLQGRAALRLVAYEDVQGGYLDNANLSVANVDKTRRDGARVALRMRLSDNWRLDTLAATQHLRSDDSQYVTVPTVGASGSLPGAPLESDGVAGAPGPRINLVSETHNNDFSYIGATLQGDFGWGSVTSSLNYVHHVFSSQYDASAVFDEEPSLGASREDLGVYVEATRSNMLVQDLVVRSADAGRLDWLVGVYGARTTEKSPSDLAVLSPGAALSAVYMENRKDRRREYAAYAEASYDFGGGWSATLGGRYFETKVHTTAEIDVTSPRNRRFFDQVRTFNGFSPKLSVQREFANGDLLYALLSEGYRPGGFNSSGLFPIRDNRTTFRPDRLRNYEIGAKLRRLDGRLVLRAAAFYDDWARIQTDQYRPSGLSYTSNVGDARIVGVEAELEYAWAFGLTLQLNGLLADSEIRNPNPDFATQVAGELPGVPKTSGGALAIYQRPLSGSLMLRLTGEASYVGRSDLSFNAALTPQMGDYLRTALSAEIATDRWRLQVYATNPLNDDGDTFAYGNPFSFGRVRQVTPQRPRTIGVRIGATF